MADTRDHRGHATVPAGRVLRRVAYWAIEEWRGGAVLQDRLLGQSQADLLRPVAEPNAASSLRSYSLNGLDLDSTIALYVIPYFPTTTESIFDMVCDRQT